MSHQDTYKVASFLPTGTSGDYRIERFTVTGKEFQGFGARYVPPGEYTRLMRGGTVVMSDTPDEIRDHKYFIHKAEGVVLIAGLGIGMVANAVANKPEVTKVIIVEISEDVIALTGPALKAVHGDKIEIVHADILEWKPPRDLMFDAIWHDIWNFICADNLTDMAKLNRKFARRKTPDAFSGSWAQGLCKDARRQANRWLR